MAALECDKCSNKTHAFVFTCGFHDFVARKTKSLGEKEKAKSQEKICNIHKLGICFVNVQRDGSVKKLFR